MGLSSSSSSKGHRSPLTEINVTPLVDVMLVLLVIFMVTAPMMDQGLSIRLPSTKGKPLETKTQPTIISVDAKGRLSLGADRTTLNMLPTQLKRAKTSVDQIFIRADQDASYGSVAKVLATIRQAGFPNVGLVTTPESSSEQ